jgi:hypothetical protein
LWCPAALRCGRGADIWCKHVYAARFFEGTRGGLYGGALRYLSKALADGERGKPAARKDDVLYRGTAEEKLQYLVSGGQAEEEDEDEDEDEDGDEDEDEDERDGAPPPPPSPPPPLLPAPGVASLAIGAGFDMGAVACFGYSARGAVVLYLTGDVEPPDIGLPNGRSRKLMPHDVITAVGTGAATAVSLSASSSPRVATVTPVPTKVFAPPPPPKAKNPRQPGNGRAHRRANTAAVAMPGALVDMQRPSNLPKKRGAAAQANAAVVATAGRKAAKRKQKSAASKAATAEAEQAVEWGGALKRSKRRAKPSQRVAASSSSSSSSMSVSRAPNGATDLQKAAFKQLREMNAKKQRRHV